MRQTRIRIPALVRTALSALAHSSRRLQSKSKSGQGLCAHTRGLTLPSRGRPPAGFARLRPPLTSNVRPQKMHELTTADRVWNRACQGGGETPRVGDTALAALLV